jgi:hypothetical protein
MQIELATKQDLETCKNEIIAAFQAIGQHPNATGQKEWLKSADVRKMLGLSAGSLQTLRIKGILPYSKMGGSLYYAYADVIKILNDNKSDNR